MARSDEAFGGLQVFDTDAKNHMPRSSWWVGINGPAFSKAIADQQERMTKSRFGRMEVKNLTTGGIDQRAALLSHRRANAPTVLGTDE